MSEILIEHADDAPPMVRGVAGNLKRAAKDRKLSSRLKKMKGVLGLKSTTDPQSATVRFDKGHITVGQGVAPDAGVVITLDLNDSKAKPKVKGAVRHLPFALNVAKVMEPPVGTWQEEARTFWAFAGTTPRMPASVRIVCTDDNSELQLGEPGPPAYEVHGSAAALVSAFSGSSVLIQDALEGKLRIVGSFEHASVLGGRGIAWAMGEGR